MLVLLLFTIPLFVSENVRLYGWVLFFIKNGVLLGTLNTFFGIELQHPVHAGRHHLSAWSMSTCPSCCSRWCSGRHGAPARPATPPSTSAPRAGRCSARSNCRSSMPGIVIGFLLTFVLAVGAVAEAKVLGGQKIIPIAHDIEIAFTYAQNWPLGAALSVLLMAWWSAWPWSRC
jgi:spermidine/putrescine transport system permease protein